MNDLIKLGTKTYVLASPVNVGFYLLNDSDVCLIDTGNSKDFAKIIDKVLIKQGWHLKYIINTHSHADHIGGNKYLQDKYDVSIFASEKEKNFINEPILEPALLYGANPLKELRSHFLMAKASVCEDIANLNVEGLSFINLEGHSSGLIGIVTSDDVCFVGDAYTSKKILDKYAIQYVYDVEKYLESMQYLLTTNYKYYVPAHGEIEEDPRETIEINIATNLAIEQEILEIIGDGKNYEEILEQLFLNHHITNNLTQYHLIGVSLKAFLTKLANEEKIEITVCNGHMCITKK